MAHAHHSIRRRSPWLLVAAVALVGALAFVAGTLLADAGDGDDRATPTAPATVSPGPSPSGEATTTPTPPPDLQDGRYFVFVKRLAGVPPEARMTFDLAEFLTGEPAAKAAAEHGDESPPPNDYYIVNDNPSLRTMPLSPSVDILAIDWTHCCEPGDVSYTDWAAAVRQPTDALHGASSPYWVTIADGAIVTINEQYLP